MDYQALWTEISTDPLSRGYSGMTDARIAIDLNTVYRTCMRDRLSSAEIYEQIVVAEFQTKTDAQKVYIRDILGLGGDVQVGPDSKARQVMLAIFGAGSGTLAALAAILPESVSRATELDFGYVHSYDVETARRRYGG